MRTSEDIYHRVRWDPRFDPARFVLGVSQRTAAPKRVALPAFVPGGDIPWHRVLYIEADGEVVWDRAAGVDRLDTSTVGRARAELALRAPFFTAGTAYTWRDGWHPAVASPPAPGPHRVRVLTWNTLWDRYDADRIDTALRRPLLLETVRTVDADVVALQEVEPELLELVLAQQWVRDRYTVCAGVREVAQSGLLLLSRLPVREVGWHRLAAYKALTALVLDTATGPLVLAATHLTSDHTDGGAQVRREELARLAEGLGGVGADVVLVGDFNDGSAELAGMLGMGDAWTLVHGPQDETATFDPVANPLAAVSSLSGRASRLDRIMLRGTAQPRTAALVGDRPVPHPEPGRVLFPSDHYGVLAELTFGVSGGDVLDAAPTARTALAWLPPQRLWPAIQELRSRYDPSEDRWPPHVNVLFGFVPESAFEQALPVLAAAAAEIGPFTATLDGVHTFGHRDDATVWLDPAAAGEQQWFRLHQAFASRFPRCRGRTEGYTPHLTLGRSADPQSVAAACSARLNPATARVGELVLLSRRGEEPMRPRAVVTLGTGRWRWLPEDTAAGPSSGQVGTGAAAARRPPGAEPDDRAAQAVVAAVRAALPDGSVWLVGSRAMGCALPGADIDLVAALPGGVDPVEVRARLAAELPDAVRVRHVTGARVPGLRLSAHGHDVDLVLVGTGVIDPADAVTRRAELGDAAAIALSAVTDAAAVADAVAAHPAAFALLARQVKAWARVRGLDSAPFGSLPGLAWSVLAARTVRESGALPPAELLRRFFGDWAGWDWRRPVALGEVPAGAVPGTVLTPSAPVRSCTDQVGPGLVELLTQEFYRAWELLEEAARTGADAWPLVAAPPPLHRRHAAWAVVSVRADGPEEGEHLVGRVRGRLRALLTALEEAGMPEVHAWPRAFTTGPVVRYAIGLGAVAPDADTVAAIATRWTADLPGVQVTLTDNGTVPTLH